MALGFAWLSTGANTNGVMVETEYWLFRSLIVYLIGVAVPKKVAKGVKVTSPVVVLTL